MDDEKKAYAVTDRAGWYVAGRKVPSRRDEDGNVVPLVGHVFWFTEAEARHELRNLIIEEVDPTTGQPVAPLVEPEQAPAPEGDGEETAGKRKKKVA
ncbi:hypothetical protein [Bosea sp. MMO-172]|uniref:hypothetical protein n=1 Tax=Bosea sp. MMO-172 TaxID=3127885 RepID=UPI00301714DC